MGLGVCTSQRTTPFWNFADVTLSDDDTNSIRLMMPMKSNPRQFVVKWHQLMIMGVDIWQSSQWRGRRGFWQGDWHGAEGSIAIPWFYRELQVQDSSPPSGYPARMVYLSILWINRPSRLKNKFTMKNIHLKTNAFIVLRIYFQARQFSRVAKMAKILTGAIIN